MKLVKFSMCALFVLLSSITAHAYPPRVIIALMGAPASGKGTQGVFINKNLNLPHLSMGDLFRDELRTGSNLGHMIIHHDERCPKEYTPSEVSFGILCKRIMNNDCNNGFILDGFPRTMEQSDFLQKVIVKKDIDYFFPIVLEVDDDEVLKRVQGRFICADCGEQARAHDGVTENDCCVECGGELCKRKEDANERTVENRINLYRSTIDEIIDDLKGFNVEVFKQSSDDTPEKVRDRISERIEARMGKKLHLSETPIFDYEPQIEVSTGFIKSNGKYLLLKRASVEEQAQTWGIPGGKLEKGETEIEGFVRETLEETGIEISDFETKNIGSFYAQHTKYYYKLHIFYVDLDAENPDVSLDPSEHSDYVWTCLEGMKNYSLILGQNEIIEKLKHFLN